MADPIFDLIKAGAKVVDLRSAEEFEDEHYDGAVNIPVNEIQARAKELGGPETPLVLYCASGARSGYAARILASAGYKKVLNAGGLSDMPGF